LKIGIKSVGAYLPYNYLTRAAFSVAWGGKGGKGEKSIADVDEDSTTMAVEAAMSCCRFVKKNDISALYFASTTGTYAEKLHSALISVACDLNDRNTFTVDFAASTRAGTNAIKAAMDAVTADHLSNVLVTTADMRNGFPKSEQEKSFGDGAAAVVVGSGDDVLAEINYFTSVNEEINDYWRNAGDKYTLHAEGRFCDEEGYLREMNLVLKKAMEETGLTATDFQKVVVVAQNLKLQAKVLAKNGFTPDKAVDTLLLNVGDTGAAQATLGLVNALENAVAGERILVLDYGNGANAMILTVTENISKLSGINQIKHYLETRNELDSYVRFLSWRDIARAEPGAPFKLQASTAQTWREQKINLRLHGSICKKCGAASFPISRICDECLSKDEYEEFCAAEHVCKLYTFSVDKYAGRSDDPVLIQAVAEDENGSHIYTIMTNFNKEDIKVGMNVEFTFRKMHELGDFPNYFWKLRPLRRERV
jgi:hydroxymethylglutaryl-CoA synthase